MKKIYTPLLIVVMLILSVVVTGCGSQSKETKQVNAENDTRVVKTLKGDVTVPTEPKKVIGLSVLYPDFLEALGITPIAVQNYHPEFPAYLKEEFKGVKKLGIAETPDFEAILAEKPDLIIAPVWWAEKDYDQLSKIAPTILLPERENWRDEIVDIGEALGKKDQATKVLQEYDKNVTEAKNTLEEKVGQETVMYMTVMPKELIVYGETQSRGMFIHKELGLTPVKAFPKGELSVPISVEKMPEYNPEHIILQLDDVADEQIQKKYKELIESPIWKELNAVKKNQVYVMGSQEWFNVSMSPLANEYAIKDILKAFNQKK